MIRKPVYLDYHSTTPVDPRVLRAMEGYFTREFGNPGSKIHSYGIRAAQAVEECRLIVSEAIHAEHPSDIIFTSGATESNNLALLGLADNLEVLGKKHIITSRVEHKAVLQVTEELENRGFEIGYVSPRQDGTLRAQDVAREIKPQTGLISIMHANNETGIVYPLEKIGLIASRNGIFFHTDASQTFGKIPIDVRRMQIDLLSLSAHKVYGPKGIGALYVKRDRPHLQLKPILFGGGQEKGLRPGTLPVPLIVGLGCAAKIAISRMETDAERLRKLRDRLMKGLLQKFPEAVVNGALRPRLTHNLNISFPGIHPETLMSELHAKIAFSGVSSCSSALWTTSHVLKAMRLEEDRVKSALRFGLGRFTTKEEIDYAVLAVSNAIHRLKKRHAQSFIWKDGKKTIQS